MKTLKSQRGVAMILELILVAVVAAALVFVYMNWQQNQKVNEAQTNVPKTEKKADPTENWTAFSSKKGQFSGKYKPDWKTLVCEGGEDNFYLSPTSAALPICQSGKGSKMSVYSREGNHISDYDLRSSEYKNITSEIVTVSGAEGRRWRGTVETKEDIVEFSPNGSITVQYVFYTNGRTYVVGYRQDPSGDYSDDVLSDFDMMVKSTLKFSS